MLPGSVRRSGTRIRVIAGFGPFTARVMSSCPTRRGPQRQGCWPYGWSDSCWSEPRGADGRAAPRSRLPCPLPRPAAVRPAPPAPQRGSSECVGKRPADRSRRPFAAWNRDAATALHASHSISLRSRHSLSPFGIWVPGSGHRRLRVETPSRVERAGPRAASSCQEPARPRSARSRRVTLQ